MVFCAAYGCTNKLRKGSGISFFKFPTEKRRRAIWEHYCHRANFTVKEWHTLCSEHFSTNMLHYNPLHLQNMGLSFQPKTKLKDDAVPDLPLLGLLINKGAGQDTLRGAYLKRQRAEIVQGAIKEYLSDSTTSTRESNLEDDVVVTSQAAITSNQSCQSVQTDHIVTTDAAMQVHLKPSQRTRRIQTKTTCVSIGVQTCLPNSNRPTTSLCDNCENKIDQSVDESQSIDDIDSYESDGTSDDEMDCQYDLDYIPSDDDEESVFLSDDEEEEDKAEYSLNPHPDASSEQQFMVSESALYQLLSTCKLCGQSSTPTIQHTKGTMICCSTVCASGHVLDWNSQPCHNKMPLSNLLLAGSSYYSGASFSKVSRLLSHMNMPMFSGRTYYKIQAAYLIPSVHHTWNYTQRELLKQRTAKSLKLGGDGRCDSPGYSAKFGSYSIMDLESNDILDIQLVQSNEVKGSTHMELEGLKRGLSFLQTHDVEIQSFVTDRHVSVKKYLKEQQPQIQHYFDVWHISKGITKKLESAAKKKGFETIHSWIQSISNHVYWSAMSSADDGELKLAKWKSIINHIADKHDGHSQRYPCCQHGELEDREWLKEGSRPYKMVSSVVLSPYLLRDIPKLSSMHQTYGIEVFHSIVNHFAPKSTHFFYPSMLARLYLAALHYNENSHNCQSITKDGVQKWKTCFPKSKKGKDSVVKPCKSAPSYAYVSLLLQCTLDRRTEFSRYKDALANSRSLQRCPPPLTDSFIHVDKQVLIERHRSRFHKC